MEEIFTADTITLQIPEEYLLGSISCIHVARDGKIFILDQHQTQSVLLFDRNGKFIKPIGTKGKGPGEFLSPRYITTNSLGEIIVSDGSLFQINIFDQHGTFLHSFAIKKMIFGMSVNLRDEIILHDQISTKFFPGNATIFAYNKHGKLLFECGTTSSTYQTLKNIPFIILNPSIAIDSDSLFEVDYPDYHIRKYWNRGKSKTEFGIQPDRWRSLLATNYKKVSAPKMVDAASFSVLDQYLKNEFHKGSKIEFIQSLSRGILMLMISDNLTGDITQDNYFCFYDTQGNLLRQGLTFGKFTKSNDYNKNYLLPVSPFGLALIQMEMPIDKIGCTRLVFLKPKAFRNPK